jgi:sulfur carrier protein ThiS
VLYVDRGGSSLQALPAAEDPDLLALALRSLFDLVADARVRELVIAKVDGEPVAGSRWKDAMLEAGFVAGYRGYVLRPAAAAPTQRADPRTASARSYR